MFFFNSYKYHYLIFLSLTPFRSGISVTKNLYYAIEECEYLQHYLSELTLDLTPEVRTDFHYLSNSWKQI